VGAASGARPQVGAATELHVAGALLADRSYDRVLIAGRSEDPGFRGRELGVDSDALGSHGADDLVASIGREPEMNARLTLRLRSARESALAAGRSLYQAGAARRVWRLRRVGRCMNEARVAATDEGPARFRDLRELAGGDREIRDAHGIGSTVRPLASVLDEALGLCPMRVLDASPTRSAGRASSAA